MKKHNNVKRDIHETILKLDELKQSEAVLSPQVKAEIRKGPSEEAKRALMHFMMRTSVPRIAAQRIKEREEAKMKNGKSQPRRRRFISTHTILILIIG